MFSEENLSSLPRRTIKDLLALREKISPEMFEEIDKEDVVAAYNDYGVRLTYQER